MSSWGGFVTGRQRRDRQVLFVVRYRSGPDAYIRVPPDAVLGPSPTVLKIAHERQVRGEIPAGEIASIVRAR